MREGERDGEREGGTVVEMAEGEDATWGKLTD